MAVPANGLKKKGLAKAVKKQPRKPKSGGGVATKAKKQQSPGHAASTPDDMSDDEEQSDHGPYCICRGPDDHRWMICCESCEDWFHGECIKMDAIIGEALIEKFICPNCTAGSLVTIYKKTCTLSSCRKAARMGKDEESMFCSDEHAQIWWERMLAKLPKGKGAAGLNDAMSQDEFMAVLQSGMAGIDENGMWRLAQDPFRDVAKPESSKSHMHIHISSVTLS